MSNNYYQLVLLWIREPALFQDFVAAASPAAARYEAAERLLSPTELHGDGVDLPHLTNVVYYRSAQAFDDWHADPQIQAALPMRDRIRHIPESKVRRTTGRWPGRCGSPPDR